MCEHGKNIMALVNMPRLSHTLKWLPARRSYKAFQNVNRIFKLIAGVIFEIGYALLDSP